MALQRIPGKADPGFEQRFYAILVTDVPAVNVSS